MSKSQVVLLSIVLLVAASFMLSTKKPVQQQILLQEQIETSNVEQNLQVPNAEYKLIKLDTKSVKLTTFSKNINKQSQIAKCLDGSPAAFYWKQGQIKENFLIYFEGGGWCGSPYTMDLALSDCLDRSSTYFGTSNEMSQTAQFGGILDNSPLNSQFWNYSVIYIHSCDGTGHQGYSYEPFSYDQKKIYFRGEKNTQEIIKYAQKNLGLDKAQSVIVTGQSSGALAAITWGDALKDMIQAKSQNVDLKVISDAGIFLDLVNVHSDEHSFRTFMKNMMAIISLESTPPNYQCTKQYQGDLWKCLFAQYSLEYVKAPVFIVQSPYDLLQMNTVQGIDCANNELPNLKLCNQAELNIINDSRTDYLTIIEHFTSTKQGWGAWVPACVVHGFSLTSNTYNGKNFEIPQHSSNTLNKALSDWLQGKKSVHIDTKPWPANIPCSGN